MSKRGSGSSTRASSRGGDVFKVDSIRLTGSQKQIQYAQDLIREEFDLISKAKERFEQSGKEKKAQGKISYVNDLRVAENYEGADRWANKEMKKLATKEWYAGDVIRVLKIGGSLDSPARDFALHHRWVNGEDAKYRWQHRKRRKEK